jgi:hypothetical protein
VRFALKDRQSLACGSIIVGQMVLARFCPDWLRLLF